MSTIRSASKVIFLDPPLNGKPGNPDGKHGPGIFYQCPHGPQKERENKRRQSSNAEKEHGWLHRDHYLDDIEILTRTALRKKYPGAYSSWKNIKQRCRKGKGVLHPSFEEFPDFLKALGPRPADGYTVDRGLDNPEYSPQNCRWASKALQTQNRRTTRYLGDSCGLRISVSEWSRRYGVPRKTIHERMRRGWSVDDAVQTPVGKRCKDRSVPVRFVPNGSPCEVPKTYSSPVAQYIPRHVRRLIDIWKKALNEKHDAPFFVPETKHVRLLKDIDGVLTAGGVDAEKVIACVTNEWGGKHDGFVSYAEDWGAFNSPQFPSLEYLRKWINAAGNFYLKRGGYYEGFSFLTAEKLAEVHAAEQRYRLGDDNEGRADENKFPEIDESML